MHDVDRIVSSEHHNTQGGRAKGHSGEGRTVLINSKASVPIQGQLALNPAQSPTGVSQCPAPVNSDVTKAIVVDGRWIYN